MPKPPGNVRRWGNMLCRKYNSLFPLFKTGIEAGQKKPASVFVSASDCFCDQWQRQAQA